MNAHNQKLLLLIGAGGLAILLIGWLLFLDPEGGDGEVDVEPELALLQTPPDSPSEYDQGEGDSSSSSETSNDEDSNAQEDAAQDGSDSTSDLLAGGTTRDGRPDPNELLKSFNKRSERPQKPVNPSWQVGDSWVVEVYFNEMQKPRGGWSAPRRFRYRVTDATRFEGHDCFEVRVEMLGRDDDEAVSDFPPELFYVDRQSYALRGIFRQSRESGKWVPRTYVFQPDEGEGSSARHTHIPFDLPPAGALAAVSDTNDPATDFIFAAEDAPRPDKTALLGAGGQYLEISFSTERGSIHQRWAVGDRLWPVESVSNKARSFRLK